MTRLGAGFPQQGSRGPIGPALTDTLFPLGVPVPDGTFLRGVMWCPMFPQVRCLLGDGSVRSPPLNMGEQGRLGAQSFSVRVLISA